MGSQKVGHDWVTKYSIHLDIFPSDTVVKNPPAKQETQAWSLGQEEPLEDEKKKKMVIHSSIAWEIPWTEKPGRLLSIKLQKSQTQLSD